MAEILKEAQHKGRFMALAVNKEAEVGSGVSLSLAGATIAGTLYVIAAFLLVYHGIHYVWLEYLGGSVEPPKLFVSALLPILMIGGAAGLALLFPRFLHMQPGLRAGIGLGLIFSLFGFLTLYVLGWIVDALIHWLAPGMYDQRLYIGGPILLLAAFVLLRWFWRKLSSESGQSFVRSLEDQGWFSTGAYKRGQGLRARRGTMLGVILLVGSGIWAYGRGATTGGLPWAIDLPLLDPRDWELVIFRSPKIMIPLLIGALGIWFAYRLISYPRFADFLIATEAEMNKVSWASKKKLVQDTIVVLVTMVLMAVFLLLVDVIWSFLLTKINVLVQ